MLLVCAGETVTCPGAFTINNTGNVNMQLTALNTSLTLEGTALACGAEVMLSGSTVTCDFTYTVTQPDREQGFAMMTAAVAGGNVSTSIDDGVPYAATDRLGMTQTIGMEFALEETSAAPHAGNGECGAQRLQVLPLVCSSRNCEVDTKGPLSAPMVRT